ncbi:MAG: protein kinase [Chlamydiota bacterium]
MLHFVGMEYKATGANGKKSSPYSLPIKLDRYRLIEWIGMGGMGEVFLAEDPVCDRKIALKRILPKRKSKESARRRFKKEACIAAQLSHPSIIPIYDLIDNGEDLYYTMPYLEGKTLKEILVATREGNDHKQSEKTTRESIPSLMLAFLNICQATEHTHEKGFLHRDLKPENIIIGKYNEVTILDWGVATEIDTLETERKDKRSSKEKLKKKPNLRETVGTIEYMAPERAFAYPATIQSDIYSLGVILHFMLTLEVPYKRPGTIKTWRSALNKNGVEPPKDPQDVAPYREITQQLSRITLKCLHPYTDKRYRSVQEIIRDLERYIQGCPDWVLTDRFDIHSPENWEFQEIIILTKQIAISRDAGAAEWILLMLSKESYSGNIQIQSDVKIQKKGSGIGFMMCVPSNSESEELQRGYLIWIGSKKHPGVKLLRDNVEVSRLDEIALEPDETYIVAIEKQDNTLRLSINNEPKLTYISHVPIVGGHFGLASKDTEFEISPIRLSLGSQNVLVNCLSVPDAFLLSGNHSRALMEYRRIAHSFQGRPEGRKATFRAGFTLIEQGKTKKGTAKELFSEALDEFELLHKTPGAPIEYLGKSLVYNAENNLQEEVKCLELAMRKFPKHPLRYVLDEHILFRLHETAQKNRLGAYAFTLLTLRYIPRIYNLTETDRLMRTLRANWENLPFIRTPRRFSSETEENLALSILLSFWLARPESIYELIQNIPNTFKHRLTLLENGLLALFELGYPKLIDFIIRTKYCDRSDPELLVFKNLYEIAIDDLSPPQKLDLIGDQASDRLLYSLFKQDLTIEKAPELLPYLEKFKQFEELYIWALLLAGEKKETAKLLERKPIQDTFSLYFILQGCYLARIEGEEAALDHFDTLIETSLPSSATFLGYFLKNHITLENAWFQQAFLWEKIQLFKQLSLYYTCLGTPRKAIHYEAMIQKELSKHRIPLDFI